VLLLRRRWGSLDVTAALIDQQRSRLTAAWPPSDAKLDRSREVPAADSCRLLQRRAHSAAWPSRGERWFSSGPAASRRTAVVPARLGERQRSALFDRRSGG